MRRLRPQSIVISIRGRINRFQSNGRSIHGQYRSSILLLVSINFLRIYNICLPSWFVSCTPSQIGLPLFSVIRRPSTNLTSSTTIFIKRSRYLFIDLSFPIPMPRQFSRCSVNMPFGYPFCRF